MAERLVFKDPERVMFARRFTTYMMRDCKRKDGSPTWEHCMRVAQAVHEHGDHDVIVALLHDIIESTSASWETLEELFGEDVANDVCVLSRDPANESYEEYIDYLTRKDVSETARRVKVADLQDNLRTVDRYAPTLRPRYEEALTKLGGSIYV